MSEFQAKFGLKYPNMSKLLEKTNHAREINLFCVTDVFYCDFVSSEPTRIQNPVHANKTGDVHFKLMQENVDFCGIFLKNAYHNAWYTAYRISQ